MPYFTAVPPVFTTHRFSSFFSDNRFALSARNSYKHKLKHWTAVLLQTFWPCFYLFDCIEHIYQRAQVWLQSRKSALIYSLKSALPMQPAKTLGFFLIGRSRSIMCHKILVHCKRCYVEMLKTTVQCKILISLVSRFELMLTLSRRPSFRLWASRLPTHLSRPGQPYRTFTLLMQRLKMCLTNWLEINREHHHPAHLLPWDQVMRKVMDM